MSILFWDAQFVSRARCLQRQSIRERFIGAMDITLTDGGIETRISYEFKRLIGDFEAYKLLEDEAAVLFCGAFTRVMLR